MVLFMYNCSNNVILSVDNDSFGDPLVIINYNPDSEYSYGVCFIVPGILLLMYILYSIL